MLNTKKPRLTDTVIAITDPRNDDATKPPLLTTPIKAPIPKARKAIKRLVNGPANATIAAPHSP